VSTSEQAALLTQSGAEQEGLRPYIVISRDAVNRNKPTCVGISLTTRTHKANSYRIFLPAGELIPDLGCAPFQDSVALCDHIRVLDISLIKKKIGRLSDKAAVAVGAGLLFIFDLR
jgi:mRNA-degrading endonuclease toxin of MazEF toxin-antitoxin module